MLEIYWLLRKQFAFSIGISWLLTVVDMVQSLSLSVPCCLVKDVINVQSSESPIESHCGAILYMHAQNPYNSRKCVILENQKN